MTGATLIYARAGRWERLLYRVFNVSLLDRTGTKQYYIVGLR